MYWPAKIRRALGLESEATLPEIFSSDDARERIRTTLSSNPAVQDDQSIVERLIEHGEIVFFRKGDQIIKEGAHDNDVYFLLSGEVDIVFKYQLGSRRKTPNQVGEMAAMDLGKTRSASVFASSDEVAALQIPGVFFNQLWANNPRFKQLLQVEMSSRHRERIVAGEIARQNNSSTWFAISAGAGLIAGLVAWFFVVPAEWTAAARMSFSAVMGLALFILTLMHNPAFFWRRCFGLVLLAMIGTFALDHFVSVEASQGLGSLQISINPGDGIRDGSTVLLNLAAYLCALIVCAYMDYLNRKD